ncbi:MAG: hypothetical protein ABJC05_06030 [Pyrinomonadaceae bacterium]
MSPVSKLISRPLCTLAASMAMVSVISFTFRATAQAQEEGTRQIVLDEFTKNRPPKAATTASSPSTQASRTRHPQSSTNRAAKRPTYRRATAPITVASTPSKQPATTKELGITVWRLRQSKQNESGARLLVMESSQSSQWTPERIEIDTPLSVGDRVRISVESPRLGYLYVIDREQYADGSLGDAYLIFPTQRTRDGDNRVRPGKLIDIPAQEDNPPYFTLVPSVDRNDQVAEILSVIVTSDPIEHLPITDKPLKVLKSDIAKWEKTWSSEIERFEMEGGAGRAWTNEEKAASATSSSRLLTQEEPAPQTVYRIASRNKDVVLVTIPLRYGRFPAQ